MSKLLSREDFLSAPPTIEKVEVPALGGHCFIRGMTAGDRDRFEAAHVDADQADYRARIAAFSICDEAGVLLFKPDDVAALAEQFGAALEPIALAANRLNKPTEGAIEDLEKNS
ncbi:MAG: hypothetical protein BGO49_11140 [Planctomycetales bacterium 71-10]|nr:MAG: hypothetical protein BGO49_11140 [Planctomycetales bacterium 71-10]